jgi:hypothetical protein
VPESALQAQVHQAAISLVARISGIIGAIAAGLKNQSFRTDAPGCGKRGADIRPNFAPAKMGL